MEYDVGIMSPEDRLKSAIIGALVHHEMANEMFGTPTANKSYQLFLGMILICKDAVLNTPELRDVYLEAYKEEVSQVNGLLESERIKWLERLEHINLEALPPPGELPKEPPPVLS